ETRVEANSDFGLRLGARPRPVLARDNPEADVRRGRIGRVGAASRDPVTIAVRVVAEERAAAQRAPVALAHVRAPFPDIAADVVETEAVRLAPARVDRRRRPARIRRVRKRALEDVASRNAGGIA